MTELTTKERNKLDKFLVKCEKDLRHITASERAEIISAIEGELLSESSNGINEALIIHRDIRTTVNRHLRERGLPSARRKMPKALLIVMITFFVSIGLVIYGIFKLMAFMASSIEFDDNMISTMGGRITISTNDNVSWDGKFDQLKEELEGNLPKGNFKLVEINAGSGAFNVKSQGDSFIYKCFTDNSGGEPIALQDKTLRLTIPGSAKCDIFIPVGIDFKLHASSGFVRLQDLEQNFNIRLSNGIVEWRERTPEIFRLRSNVRSGMTFNRLDQFSRTGKYQADITIDKGALKIR